MKFQLEISLGNDAMQTEEDLKKALNLVASRITTASIGTVHRIPDVNGNTVGWYMIDPVTEVECEEYVTGG